MAQSASEKALLAIETQKILRESGHFRQVAKDKSDAAAQQLAADLESGRLAENAKAVAAARHAAAMADFQTGNAAARAIEGYKVKRTVADFALSEGRDSNGRVLAPVVPVTPAMPKGVKAPEGWDKVETSTDGNAAQ